MQLSNKSRIASDRFISRVNIVTKNDLTGEASTDSYLGFLSSFVIAKPPLAF
jgi:hypothetical protein